MKAIFRILLAGPACAVAFALSTPVFADVTPTGDSAIQGPAPSSSYVWMAGHWDSEGGQWKWSAAHWEQPPTRSATWVSGHWVSDSGKWVWVNGAWNVSESAQAQSAPPQPPTGQSLQNSPAVMNSGPMPATPAPYVEGEDGPGGVSRVVDQGEVVTDYGPDYYAAYPGYGYGWAGYPGYWDGGLFIGGFGFGGFYGHGGYYRGYGHGRGGFVRGGGHVAHGASGGHFGGHSR